MSEWTPCCEWFGHALREGTDNEGFGPALYWESNGFYAGEVTHALKYCPWCGKELGEAPIATMEIFNKWISDE